MMTPPRERLMIFGGPAQNSEPGDQTQSKRDALAASRSREIKMRLIPLFALLLAAAPALGQTPGIPLAPLPATDLDDDAPAETFLKAARLALALGRGGEAMEALERAESRALTREVRPSRAGRPSDQNQVTLIARARTALAAGDRMATIGLIDQALTGSN